jgi:ribosomal protein S18 acetylase RimI-like enzyme
LEKLGGQSELESLAIENGSLMGCLYFQQENSQISILLIVIEPSYRGKGYAKRLLAELEEVARQRNIKKLVACGVDKVKSSIVGLLKKNGYDPLPDSENYIKLLND